MKIVISILAILSYFTIFTSQSFSLTIPQTINYQGYLTDDVGVPVTGTKDITFRIYDLASGGVPADALWTEPQSVTVSNGVYTVKLGSVNTITILNFDVPYFLGIEVETDGEMTPRQPVDSVPFAVTAAQADQATIASSVQPGSINDDSITGPISAAKIDNNGLNADLLDGQEGSYYTNWANLLSVPQNLLGIGGLSCTDGQIAKYVGTVWTCVTEPDHLPLSGGLMSGDFQTTANTTLGDSSTDSINIMGRVNSSILPTMDKTYDLGSTLQRWGDVYAIAFIGDGLGLANLNASNLATGTIADTRLSANVGLLDADQSVTGVKTFNPATGTVPFTVDSSKTGLVASLNADLLDGQQASEIIATASANVNAVSLQNNTLADLDVRYTYSPPQQTPRSKTLYKIADGFNLDTPVRSSITIGTDGLPIISYHRDTDLRVVKCNDPSCASFVTSNITVSDSSHEEGLYNSIAIGIDGYPVISYLDEATGLHHFAKCNDTSCASYTVSPGRFTAGLTSLSIGTDGRPIAAHLNNTQRLGVNVCNDPSCLTTDEHSVYTGTVDPQALTASLAIGVDGNPIISSDTGGSLRITKCLDKRCELADSYLLNIFQDPWSRGESSSLTIGTDGYPVIAHSVAGSGMVGIQVLRCLDFVCSPLNGGPTSLGIIEELDDPNTVSNVSIALGRDGFPVVLYHRYNPTSGTELKLAKCADAGCTNSIKTIVDSSIMLDSYSSLAMGADGAPVITYVDDALDPDPGLKVLKCANEFCLDNWTRR